MQAATKTSILLGQCVPCVKHNISKFRIRRMELDNHLLMYFKKDEFVYAHDDKKICKSGDVALIEVLPDRDDRVTRLVTHRVAQIVYPLGDVTDPLTGKAVVVGRYRDHIDQLARAYGGMSPSAFDYTTAKPRGWQQQNKDFTDKQTYTKYDERDTSPYAT